MIQSKTSVKFLILQENISQIKSGSTEQFSITILLEYLLF